MPIIDINRIAASEYFDDALAESGDEQEVFVEPLLAPTTPSPSTDTASANVDASSAAGTSTATPSQPSAGATSSVPAPSDPADEVKTSSPSVAAQSSKRVTRAEADSRKGFLPDPLTIFPYGCYEDSIGPRPR